MLVHKFSTHTVEWRWENMEDALVDELSIYTQYGEALKMNSTVLKNDTALGQKIRSAYSSDTHEVLSLLLCMIARCLGTIDVCVSA